MNIDATTTEQTEQALDWLNSNGAFLDKELCFEEFHRGTWLKLVELGKVEFVTIEGEHAIEFISIKPPADEQVIYVSTPDNSETVIFNVLTVVCNSLIPVEALLKDGNTEAALQHLQQFISDMREKQQEILDIFPF